jgi:Ring finger domain
MSNHIKQHCSKSTQAFDECSICLERMMCITFRSKVLGVNICRLSCGHCFHKQCFDLVKETSGYCPICRKLFFDTNEKLLLKGLHDVQYINQMKPDRVDAVLREAVSNKDDKLVALLIERHDPSEVLHHFICKKDTRAISQLICSKCINWHKTVNGKTLMDVAAETNDKVITYIVSSSKCYNLHKHIIANK